MTGFIHSTTESGHVARPAPLQVETTPIKIVKSQLLRGCNIYHGKSVIQLEVDLGRLANQFTSFLGDDFVARFRRRFLERNKLLFGRGIDMNFVAKLESRGGVPVEEALLHGILAVETTILAIMHYLDRIEYAAVFNGEAQGQAFLIWETHAPALSRISATVGLQGFVELLTEASYPVDMSFEHGLEALKARAIRRRLAAATSVVRHAAKERGLPCGSANGQHLRVGYGARQHVFFSSMTGTTSVIACNVTSNKQETIRLLGEVNLPVPRQLSVFTAKEAISAVKQIGFPAVIKPVSSAQGCGVTAGLLSLDEVIPAFERASEESARVLVESYVEGPEYRLLVIGGQFVAAVNRVPPTVVGDGVRTVRQLVEELNDDPRRDKWQLYPVVIDEQLELLLKRQKSSLEQVLENGVTVTLASTSNVSTGGSPIDVTHLVHPDNRLLAEKAADRVGLDVAGIDYISRDISRSYKEVGGGIVEVNSNPGLDIHVWMRRSETRDVGAAVLELKFPPGDDGTVPRVLVAGDRGTGRIARAAGELLQDRGVRVGLSLKRAAYLDGRPLDLSGAKLAEAPQILLRDPSLECLVGAVSLRRAATRGLNLEACDAAAILPRRHDRDAHVFDQGMEVLIKANRGRFVIATGNAAARSALAGVDPARVILVSAQHDDADAQAHIAAGRCAVVKTWDGGRPHLTLFDNGQPTAALPLQDGAQAQPKDIEAQIFALALAYAVGLNGRPLDRQHVQSERIGLTH